MVGIRISRTLGLTVLALLALASASAVEVDLSDRSAISFDRPVALATCEGCPVIVGDPIERSITTSVQRVNATHETWTAEVTVSTSFAGTYRNVPLAIEVPKTALLDASGNTPYAIKTEGNRRFILMRIPELEDERTVRITVLNEAEQKTIWDRISRVLGSF